MYRRILYAILPTATLISCLFAAGRVPLNPSQVRQYDRLTHELIAPCCWREPIAIHRSTEARQMLVEVEQLVAEGRSENEIKGIYLSRYGPRILADPPGPERYWLYLMPLVLLCSLMFIAVVRLRSLVEASSSPHLSPPPELIAQVRKETDGDWN